MGSDLKGYDICIGILTVAILLSAGGKGAWSQQTPACVSKLIPCSDYLNSTTTPPDTCCNPLREAVRTDLDCLCTLYSSPDIFKSFGINMTQALMLPKHCGVTSTDLCNKSVPPGSAGPAGKDTGTSSGSPPGSKSGANVFAWIGFSSLMSVFMLWASVVV